MTTDAEIPFDITDRVEIIEPTDRVRGTVVNVTACIFVVHYDNGDYVAYDIDEAENFKGIPLVEMPFHAKEEIVRIRRALGRTPPEDVMLRRPLRRKLEGKLPRQAEAPSPLTPAEGGGTIEA